MTKDLFEVFEQMRKTLEADRKTSGKSKTRTVVLKKDSAVTGVVSNITDGIYPVRQELNDALKEKKD